MKRIITASAIGIAVAAAQLWSPTAIAGHEQSYAQNGPPGHQGRGRGKGRDRYEVEERYQKKGRGGYKYKYKSKRKKRRHHVEYRGRRGPPPWAPAHGYRAKRGHRDSHREVDYVHTAGILHLPDAGVGSCNRDAIGAILGGVTGAAAGTQFGKGDGKTLATIGGAIVGALVGGNIGRAMDQVDQNCIGQALERAPEGRTVTWQNPDEGGQYQVTPQRTYQTDSGAYCREYQTTVVVGGRTQKAYGTACRQPDGSWKKQS